MRFAKAPVVDHGRSGLVEPMSAYTDDADKRHDERTDDELLADKELGPSHSRVQPKTTWLVENQEPDVGEVFDIDGTLAEVESIEDDETILDTEDGRTIEVPTGILLRRYKSVPRSMN